MRRCEVQGKPLRVAVLLSGGVDSSLALALLRAAGHSVRAFYLQIWFQEDFRNFWGQCPWEEDLGFARQVSIHYVFWRTLSFPRDARHPIGNPRLPLLLCHERHAGLQTACPACAGMVDTNSKRVCVLTCRRVRVLSLVGLRQTFPPAGNYASIVGTRSDLAENIATQQIKKYNGPGRTLRSSLQP